MSPELVTHKVKFTAHSILVDALLSAQTALNAALALYEISWDDRAKDASDEILQAMAHLGKAGHHIYQLPSPEIG